MNPRVIRINNKTEDHDLSASVLPKIPESGNLN